MKTIILLLAVCIAAINPVTAIDQVPTHDQDVAAKIQFQLNLAFARPGSIDVATRIQSALKGATDARDASGMSQNETLRDTEYYLHGLYGGAARDWAHILPVAGTPFYNALKWAALRCKDAGFPDLEQRMRTQPGSPVSEPGGTDWAYRGLRDGYSLNGKTVVGPRPGHGLSLPALEAVTPCKSN